MKNIIDHKNTNVAVLLLNWNGIEFTVPCIESLISSGILPSNIIVVDNASIDGSVNILLNLFPNIIIIENKINLGFSGGNNVGFQRLLNDNFDYIWVLNNDTIVDVNCIWSLIEVMEADQGIAAATGKILYEGSSDLIWYAGSYINYATLKSSHIGQLKNDFGQYDVPHDVPFISGCCMLLRTKTLETVGLFDNNFFAYSEDLDWCLRAGELGMRLRYVPQARLFHKVSATFNKLSNKNNGGSSSLLSIYLTTRNHFFIIRKHSKNSYQFISALISFVVSSICYGIALLFLLRISKLKSLSKGIFHGLTNDISGDKF